MKVMKVVTRVLVVVTVIAVLPVVVLAGFYTRELSRHRVSGDLQRILTAALDPHCTVDDVKGYLHDARPLIRTRYDARVVDQMEQGLDLDLGVEQAGDPSTAATDRHDANLIFSEVKAELAASAWERTDHDGTDVTMGPFQSITIIEFKRPMRTSYYDEENPFKQVLEYIDEIIAGKALTPEKRPIPISNGVHFYCYIVADKTDELAGQAKYAELEETPDGQGFFGYKKGYRAYIEFVSYSKLLDGAKQRNLAFFEKLGLPLVIKGS